MPNPFLKKRGRELARPLGGFLARAGVSADSVTLAGLLLAVMAGLLLARDAWLWAFVALIGSGLCDLVDGAVARARGGRGTAGGAILDSTIDRYGEAVVLAGVLVHGVGAGVGAGFVWLWSLALTGSFLTSYVRARAEGLGVPCEVGLMERPERLALLGLLCLLGPRASIWILAVLAAGSHITFLQRLIHVRRATRGGRLE